MEEMSSNKRCVHVFKKMIREFSYKGTDDGKAPLWNLTFFLGAGFSYAWDVKYPLGTKLFEIDCSSLLVDDRYEYLNAFCKYCGYSSKMGYDDFTSLYYRLQMMKKHVFLQGRFWDNYALNRVEHEIRKYIVEAFKSTTNLETVDASQKFAHNPNKGDIYNFFGHIMSQITGSAGFPEGIRTNFLTTNYDFIIENIIDANVHDDLPYYYYSYRGFTPHIANGTKQCICPHENQDDYPLIKLNGGFEIFKDGESFSLDYRDAKNSAFKDCVPEIILPCQEQTYDTEYFKIIFPKANRILQESDVLFISGYSFPKEDGLIRFLLKQYAESTRDVRNKYIFYVDFDSNDDEKKLRERILDIFPDFRNRLFTYTKGFDSFAKEYNALPY